MASFPKCSIKGQFQVSSNLCQFPLLYFLTVIISSFLFFPFCIYLKFAFFQYIIIMAIKMFKSHMKLVY